MLRGTEVNDFLRCRTRWNYAWNEKLTPKTPNDKLFFGTLFHKYVEVLYNAGNIVEAYNAMSELFDNADLSGMEQVAIDELWSLAIAVTNSYVSQWWQHDLQYEVLATELQFAIPLTDTLTYTGTIDLLLKDKDGKVWFMDHKTTSSIESYEKRADMDRQISRYWYALQRLGYDVAGFIYNIVLKEVPRVPELLKKGGLSQNKAQKTTYDLYLQAIEDNDLNPADYTEMLDHLKAQGNRYFRRINVVRLQSEIDNAIEELIAVSQDMNNARIYRNITKDCHWDCSFQSICQASMDGSNVDYLKGQLFRKKEFE